ncbi:penicillin acylase family protein [Glaciecola sp. XM2]|jgi:penicillin amidase|uniref:penicillin acylase family protein n=1 Tax=Glaciecola sp. XM2 TaxID=1914931 RepID=UPI001BDE4E13|nr:penicillin acylase family protein [Glaciecola sp. XM2]MBT1449746.1 penicillin acylase family protein [Glaciecola sp. XM2]
MKIIKIIIVTTLVLISLAALSLYLFLNSHLPDLDGERSSSFVYSQATLARDALGSAIVHAQTQHEAAYLLGFAHAQDRLFQMDLLRRNSAGELSELVGERAISTDERARFFQFRKRAEKIFENLPSDHKRLLTYYTNGVNTFIEEHGANGFEYTLLGAQVTPWREEDSLLVNYSMYMDLQRAQVDRDFENTAIKKLFGQSMLDFLYQNSTYQAAIDESFLPLEDVAIPSLDVLWSPERQSDASALTAKTFWQPEIKEPQDIGSNNWAVSGNLTDSTSAMMSSDMHLSLGVPAIWYRAQLNYKQDEQDIAITGVSLPGTPLVVAGTNGHIAWGFTNSNVDNVDWIRLAQDTPTHTVEETIALPNGETHVYTFEMSELGPVRELAGEKYALKWVALEAYGANMQSAEMAGVTNVQQALELAKSIAIPVQNMVVADAQGNIAWQLTGAITARTTPSLSAIDETDVDTAMWAQQESAPAFVLNPDNDRVWSANARVVSADDFPRYGDGGYALGARQEQIVDALFAQNQFDEKAFNDLQLDNKALFLSRWHTLLTDALQNDPQKYATDLEHLNNWQACACAESIGYTLVRRFRSQVINQLMAPVDEQLATFDMNLRQGLRGIEPGIWQLLLEQPAHWLPQGYTDYPSFLMGAYDDTLSTLIERHDANPRTLEGLQWGKVNALQITHPFASSLGPLASFVNMPVVAGYGDSFMPAVQGSGFGASQRLIVRPGNLDKAVLTVPGGQSMHPMSAFFEAGFSEYANGELTPLLPQAIQHTIVFNPAK